MNVNSGSRFVGAAATLVVAGLLAACSSHSGQESASGDRNDPAMVAPPKAVLTPAVSNVPELTLPIQAYQPSLAQRTVVENATVSLVNACMHRFGFDDVLPPGRPSQPSLLSRRYGVTDPAIAQRYGYHVAPGDRIETGSKPAENGGELSQSAILVLTGEPNGRPRPGAAAPTRTYAGVALPAGGCSGEAAAKLGQGQLFGGATTLADRIMTTSFAQAESDDRVVAVFGTWSDCMKQQGYAFKTPFDAAASANIETPAPSTVEIKTAVADVACKQKTNLVGVFYGVERGYQDSAIQQNIEQLNKLKAEIDQVVKAAAGALGVPVPK